MAEHENTENAADGSGTEVEPLTLSGIQSEHPELLKTLLNTYVMANRNDVVENRLKATGVNVQNVNAVKPKAKLAHVIFAVDDYAVDNPKYTANAVVPEDMNFDLIIPRSAKAKAIQKRRVKEKAEVFTPTWVCNVQNNLIDDHTVGQGAFNTHPKSGDTEDQKSWEPSNSPVVFKNTENIKAAEEYIDSNRLEITCGEGPYLSSGYDTVTGERIPVRDSQGRFKRIGLLDRKLRVVTETAGSIRDEDGGDEGRWTDLAYRAFCSTYGYEWQGDNLLLARLNLLNAYRDYYYDAWEKEPSYSELHRIAVVISMNIWQMDGLENTVPLSADTRPVISFDHGTFPADTASPSAGDTENTASTESTAADITKHTEAMLTRSNQPPEWIDFLHLVDPEEKKGRKEKKEREKRRGKDAANTAVAKPKKQPTKAENEDNTNLFDSLK